MTASDLADEIRRRAGQSDRGKGRFITALAGPAGSGKSTLAAAVVAELGPSARAVPMDGFHYDDAILNARGLRSRKGAPETFDARGFLNLMRRLRSEDEVAIPVFDRALELSRGSADIVTADHRVLVVEGNYLLLNEAPWTELAPFFDLTAFIDVPEAELDRRLLNRWAQHGKSPAEARAWIDSNDMPNIRRVTKGSRKADVVISWA